MFSPKSKFDRLVCCISKKIVRTKLPEVCWVCFEVWLLNAQRSVERSRWKFGHWRFERWGIFFSLLARTCLVLFFIKLLLFWTFCLLMMIAVEYEVGTGSEGKQFACCCKGWGNLDSWQCHSASKTCETVGEGLICIYLWTNISPWNKKKSKSSQENHLTHPFLNPQKKEEGRQKEE